MSNISRNYDKKQVLDILKKIFELEMAGVIRYTHYALMIFGSNRLPLVEFFREQAKESWRAYNWFGGPSSNKSYFHQRIK